VSDGVAEWLTVSGPVAFFGFGNSAFVFHSGFQVSRLFLTAKMAASVLSRDLGGLLIHSDPFALIDSHLFC
jgi:hypothetical protein